VPSVSSEGSGLLRQSLGLTALAGVAAVLSALYLSIAGHLLGPAEYGILATLLSMAALASLLLATVETGVAKLAAELHGVGAPGALRALTGQTIRRCIRWLALALLLWLPLLPWLRGALRLGSPWQLIAFTAFMSLYLVVSVLRGTLRGDHRFFALGTNLVGESAARLATGTAAIALGAGAAGAIGGYVGAMTTAALLACWQLRDLRRHPMPAEPVALGRLLTLSGPLLFLFSYFQLAVSLDMLVAKTALLPVEAGVYGACSTLIRLLLVAAVPFFHVLFSRVSARHARGLPVRGLVLRALGVATFALLTSNLVPWVLGDWLLAVVFGADFVSGGAVLRVLWATASLLILQQLAAFSLLAANHTRGGWTFLIPGLVLAGLLWRYHGSAEQIAWCGLGSVLSGFLSLAIVGGQAHRDRTGSVILPT
jgi:O-antigen/teichoic acid export membrane protein